MGIAKSAFTKDLFFVFVLGIVGGVPLYITADIMQAWMVAEGIEISTIGVFSIVGLPYTLKFLWAPLMDRYLPSFLGRRRGWLLISQIGLISTVILMSFSQPQSHIVQMGYLALLVAFFSASQDIVIDAHRREILTNAQLGVGSSYYIVGYRMGMLLASAALVLADYVSFHTVYLCLAVVIALLSIPTFFVPEPPMVKGRPQTFQEAVVGPFLEFFKRKGAIEILLFILLYKLGDQLVQKMTIPYYLHMGFTKTQIGLIAKTVGLSALMAGGMIGGMVLINWGFKKGLWIFGIIQSACILLYSLLYFFQGNVWALGSIIAFENICFGMGGAAYAGYMAYLCNRKFTATQYALFTSLMGIPRVIFGTSTGFIAQNLGWIGFFIFCTVAAIPGMLLLLRYDKWEKVDET